MRNYRKIFLLDEKKQTFDWLEKARKAGEPWLIMIGMDPLFDRLRADGRFVGLLQKMGLKNVR